MSSKTHPNIKVMPGVRFISGGPTPLLGFWSEIDTDEQYSIARKVAGAIGGTCRIRDADGNIVLIAQDTVPGVTQKTSPYAL